MPKAEKKKKDEPLEKILWQAADKLRKNIGAAEYKHIVLGLIFLKYISDAFEERYKELAKEEHADPEDIDEYRAVNAFYVPKEARWDFLLSKSKQPTIGKIVDAAMDAIEANHPQLKGILPKVYARPNLDHTALGGLIDKFSNLALGTCAGRSKDLLGQVYEYFLGQFALAEGQKGGKFYTPGHVVRLLVEMLQPYKGQVFDPCCGSGGMFVHSEKFVLAHQGKIDDISIFGQESDLTTWRLAKMNLAIRGIDSSNVKWNNQGSFLKDEFRDNKFDFIIANPPFNDSDWSGDLLQKDGRWQYGLPPVTNANFAWIQHFIYHLKPTGIAGFVMPDTSLSSPFTSEESIRRKIVQAGLLDCVVTLPSHLFTNTSIAACLWFLSRNKNKSNKRETLFIDASKMGVMQKRKNRVLQDDDIKNISETYHHWRDNYKMFKNIKGFCRSVDMADIENNDFVLSPNRYVSPVLQQIAFKIDFESEVFQTVFQKQAYAINKQVIETIELLKKNEPIDLKKAFELQKESQNLLESSDLLFKGLLKKYFLDYEINSLKKRMSNKLGEQIPEGWQTKSFEELFEQSNLKVKDIGYCPPLYSVTNLGISLREGKYTKELSKSTSSYKIAYRGDMVFGLSREIPNLDVFSDAEGAFSGAYHIYRPKDIRIGLIIGNIMRLKLNEQVDILKGGAREGRGLDKEKLMRKEFIIPSDKDLNTLWKLENM